MTIAMCEKAMNFVRELHEHKQINIYAPVIVLLPPRDRPQQPLRLTSIAELEELYPPMADSMKQLLSQMVDDQYRWIIHLLWLTDNKVLHKIVRGRYPELEDLHPFQVSLSFFEEGQEEVYWKEEILCYAPNYQRVMPNCKPVPPRGRVDIVLSRGDNVMQGSLEYSTRTLSGPSPSPSQSPKFMAFPQEKLLKLYVGDRVVHLILRKVSNLQSLHRDQRDRMMIYECWTVQLIKRQEAETIQLPKQCVLCGMQSKLKCSLCGVFYCSKKCQRDDWKCHKRSHV